jgi:drug/metabolite transporter (DMT)-like permease
MGTLVASPAVALPYRFGVLAVVLAVIPLIVRSDRKRTGMFINGYRRGKTRWVTFAMLAAVLGLYALSVHAALENGDRLTSVLLGLLAAVGASLGSVLWQRVFVREMGL